MDQSCSKIRLLLRVQRLVRWCWDSQGQSQISTASSFFSFACRRLRGLLCESCATRAAARWLCADSFNSLAHCFNPAGHVLDFFSPCRLGLVALGLMCVCAKPFLMGGVPVVDLPLSSVFLGGFFGADHRQFEGLANLFPRVVLG